jgi:hypothetical protein
MATAKVRTPTRIVPIRLGSARCTSNEVGADSFGIASSVRGTRYPAKGELLPPGNTANRWQAQSRPVGPAVVSRDWRNGTDLGEKIAMVVAGEFFPK